MFRRVMTPVDQNDFDASTKAFAAALDLIETFTAELIVLTVAPWALSSEKDALEARRAAFHEKITALAGETGLPIKGAFRSGDSVSLSIADAAREFEVDLVVMSSHEPSLSDYLFGSRAASVALHSPCSVLVVR